MNKPLINKQNDAERDDYLFDCFFDYGIIEELLKSSYSTLTGRKGAGKTAIAKYLEKNASQYEVDFVYRISVRDFNTFDKSANKVKHDHILQYIVIALVRELLKKDLFTKKGLEYWKDFLQQNGFQNISDYETFVEVQQKSKRGFSIKASLQNFFAKAEAGGETSEEKSSERVEISKAPAALFEALKQTLKKDSSLIVFIDDMSDYLDESDVTSIKNEISIIKNVLLSLENFNLSFRDSGLKARFVSLVRDDLFEFMEGSNINKIRSDSLEIEWDERSFASLLIKRMPFFADDLEEALKNPISSIKREFPDDIFADTLANFSTNRYKSNFYAYMVAISFNRPRDFLQFGYALRDRLSRKHPATFENIESAEIEYADYFMRELRDELYVASKFYDYDIDKDRVDQLVDLLGKNEEGFNPSQLRAELAQYLDTKTSLGRKKIDILITELWRYGIVGYSDKNKEKADQIIKFKYFSRGAYLNPGKLKEYVFHLHRGLWWFAKKRRSKIKNKS